VGSGFECKKVLHVTLKSMANREPPGEEATNRLWTIPAHASPIPLPIKAVPAPNVKSIDDLAAAGTYKQKPQGSLGDFCHATTPLLVIAASFHFLVGMDFSSL
jgi:hypothetical protein